MRAARRGTKAVGWRTAMLSGPPVGKGAVGVVARRKVGAGAGRQRRDGTLP